jgi:pilus assembly protein CpaC
MKRTTVIRNALALIGLAMVSAGSMPLRAAEATPPQQVRVNEGESKQRFIALGIGKSAIIDLPRDAKDVLVGNPAIANAVVRSTRRAYLIGAGIGQTNVFFFDGEGHQIAGFDIAVTRDLNGIRAALRQILPNANIKVEGLGPDGIVLAGVADNAGESQQAFDLAARLVGDPSKVVNSLTIKERDQVMLKVTVAEVERDVVKQFGIDLSGTATIGHSVLNVNTSNPFTAFGKTLASNAFPAAGAFTGVGWQQGGSNVTAILNAMDRAGVIRTLAEPNLTAVSGENATFLAGGEFPVPGGYTCDNSTGQNICQTQIQWKKFGVGLNFTPVVLSGGRISLKVMTEVSELSPDNAIVLQPTAGSQAINIPSIRARRAETTVEIPSGGALALAGMIQEQTKQALNGMPGIMQVPILGSLFKSRDYVNNQTELMVIVTPYIVRAVAPKQLARPDDGFVDSSDPTAILMGKFNRLYGSAARNDGRPYRGAYGFIMD